MVSVVPNIQASYTINSQAPPPATTSGLPERSKTESGSEGPVVAFSAGVNTAFLLEREDLGTSPWQDVFLGNETKMFFPSYGIFSAI